MEKFKWKPFVKELNAGSKGVKYKLNQPCKKADVFRVELKLNLDFNDDLKNFYFQGNGISEFLDKRHIGQLIMPVEELEEVNKTYRKTPEFKSLYKPFDNVLFFSHAGNGDLFGLKISDGKMPTREIFVWNHETDERNLVANNLVDFIKGWTSSQIKI